MRTTLSLDDDVARLLERVRTARRRGLKDVVNEALRRGLRQLIEPPQRGAEPFRTRSVDLGRCRFGDLDDIAEALAVAEDERLP